MASRRACAAALALLGGSAGAAAQAAPPSPISVDWRAPGSCPSGADVAREIHRLLGGVPDGRGRTLEVRGRVEAGSFGFALELETADERGRSGHRSLTSTSCEALADAAALVVALGWDPAAVAATRAQPTALPIAQPTAQPPPRAVPALPPTAPPAAPAPPARPPPAPEVAGPPPPRPPPATSTRPPRFAVGAGLVLDAGGLPGVSAGVEGSFAVLLGAYRLEIHGTGFPASEAALEGDPARGGRFVQISAAGQVARTLWPWEGPGDHGEVSASLGLEGGATLASGFGVDSPQDATVGWVAPRAGVGARLALPAGLGAQLGVGIAVPLERGPFVLDRLGEVHRPAPVAGRASLGLDLRF